MLPRNFQRIYSRRFFPDREIDLKNLTDLLFGGKVFCVGSDENNVALNESGQFFIRLSEQPHERIRITMDPRILLRLHALSDIALQRLFSQIYAPHSNIHKLHFSF